MALPTTEPIEKLDLPEPRRYAVNLRSTEYTFHLKYNAKHDFFSFDLYDTLNEHIHSQKIVYGSNLVPETTGRVFAGFISENQPEINRENFNETVFLYIFE